MTRCFVIGPIGSKLSEVGSEPRKIYEDALAVYEDVIRPACQANGLEPIRADGIAVAGEIPSQIFRHLYEDDVVIADVSGANPNVMYELGLRHTRDLLTVQIGEFGQLPFDINAVRTIQFSRSERGLIEARRNLEHALRIGLADGGDPLPATRIWNGQEPEQDAFPTSAQDGAEEVEEDLDEDGLIERIARIETAFPEMTETLESITAVMESMGEDAQKFGAEFSGLPEDAPTSNRLSIIARYASALQGPADEFTVLTDRFESQMKSTDVVMRGIFADLGRNPDMLLTGGDTEEFLDQIIDMAASSREAMETFSELGDQVYALGSLSRVLRRPAKQIKGAVRKMAAAATLMDTWESAISRLRAKAAGGEGQVIPDETSLG